MHELETFKERKSFTTKVFFEISDGKVSSIIVGNQAVPVTQGYQFHVRDYVAEQIEKCDLYMDGFIPKLILKDGEELDIPTEHQEKLSEIEELKRKLKELEENT